MLEEQGIQITGLTTGRFFMVVDLHLCSSSISSAAIRLKSTEEGGMWSASAPGSSATSLYKKDMNIWPASSLIFENCSFISALRAARSIDTINTIALVGILTSLSRIRVESSSLYAETSFA